mmetsp:Transcript_17708/g.44982  ORF Transcript_17708/g.44982 Transcript_17708/m.44982 type:complete len:201 (-) Transcript_17708:415-1017(-)
MDFASSSPSFNSLAGENSDARVTIARYISSLSPRSSAIRITGIYAGISSVTTHGPSSALAPSSPFSRAFCAKKAKADGGTPRTRALSVILSENALVASCTLFEKSVLICDRRCWISVNRAFSSDPSSSATPASLASRRISSIARFSAPDSAAHFSASPFTALKYSKIGRDCDAFSPNSTAAGRTASTASRSACASRTAFK